MRFDYFFNLLILGASAALALESPSELQVMTSSGLVNGKYNNSAQTVRGFIGIPYAEPRVKALRFAPPQAKSRSNNPIDGSSFSYPCPQVYSYSNESIWSVLPYEIWNSAEMSEDCLYVNIWAPSRNHEGKEKANEKAAVMMFIHGGAFTSGAASVAFYDGTDLVQNNDNIIVVTFK